MGVAEPALVGCLRQGALGHGPAGQGPTGRPSGSLGSCVALRSRSALVAVRLAAGTAVAQRASQPSEPAPLTTVPLGDAPDELPVVVVVRRARLPGCPQHLHRAVADPFVPVRELS